MQKAHRISEWFVSHILVSTSDLFHDWFQVFIHMTWPKMFHTSTVSMFGWSYNSNAVVYIYIHVYVRIYNIYIYTLPLGNVLKFDLAPGIYQVYKHISKNKHVTSPFIHMFPTLASQLHLWLHNLISIEGADHWPKPTWDVTEVYKPSKNDAFGYNINMVYILKILNIMLIINISKSYFTALLPCQLLSFLFFTKQLQMR